MEIEIIENGKYIITKNNNYYLVIKERIAGTLYNCYGIYTDYSNIKQNLLELETNDLQDITEKPTLEEALYFINNYNNED